MLIYNPQHGVKLQGISVLIGLFAGLNARAKTYRIVELPGEYLWVHVCWLSITYRNCYDQPLMTSNELVWHSTLVLVLAPVPSYTHYKQPVVERLPIAASRLT